MIGYITLLNVVFETFTDFFPTFFWGAALGGELPWGPDGDRPPVRRPSRGRSVGGGVFVVFLRNKHIYEKTDILNKYLNTSLLSIPLKAIFTVSDKFS